jgi:hypothetical protein
MRWIRATPVLFVAAAAAIVFADAPSKPTLPWIEDDYGRALAEAKSKKLPIFVEAWAPW